MSTKSAIKKDIINGGIKLLISSLSI